MLIAVVGDCTLDVSLALPSGPMAPGSDARATIGLGPGGQAANVAVRLARRGLDVRLVCPLADDAGGDVLRAHLRREGVALTGLTAARTSVVAAFIHPGGDRSMLSDRVPLDGDLAAALAGSDWVHVSGYVLRGQPEADRVVEAVGAARPRVVSVAGGSFAGRADGGIARDAIEAMGAALVVMNRDEADLLGAPSRSAAQAAERLATAGRLAVVTDGRHGAIAAGCGVERLTVPAPNTSAVDATGAGDAFTAALLARLTPAWPPDARLVLEALIQASQAGAEASAEFGAQARTAGER